MVSLITNVLVDEVLTRTRSKLEKDESLPECPILSIKTIVELLEICVKTTYSN